MSFAQLSIRAKLTLPYVLLSLLIALWGGVIVTQVVIDSVQDRFTDQLIETRKLASELVVREESRLLETLRLLSYVQGMSSAVQQQDQSAILQVAFPLVFNSEEDVVLILDDEGNVLAAMLKAQDGEYQFPQVHEKLDSLPFVARLVEQDVDQTGDKYAGVSNLDWGSYFFVSGPIHDENGVFVGAVLVGKSLQGIVQEIREETLSQATIYDSSFQPISSTFIELPVPPAIQPETVLDNKTQQSLMRDVSNAGLAYTELLSAWEVRGGEDFGILGTALPKTFLIRANRITRLNVALQAGVAVIAALLLGLALSRFITNPILHLKEAATQIAKGNLKARVDTRGTDEVAVLAQTFNEMAHNLLRSQADLVTAYDKTIEGWVKALELRDRETLGHTLRAASLTLELARRMNIDESKLENIHRGVLLHDIGKMGIPDHILLKPGPLTLGERKIIEEHPSLAREMLEQIEFLHPCIDIPYFHHERWDGSGYPNGLAGEQIPIEARLFAIIDVWDALTSDRTYRRAWPPEEALRYLQEQSGKAFDPQVVEAFVGMMTEEDGSLDPSALQKRLNDGLDK
jgi:putative nucleotidyltransferase with HDIG domain